MIFALTYLIERLMSYSMWKSYYLHLKVNNRQENNIKQAFVLFNYY